VIKAQLTAWRGYAQIGITLDRPRQDGTWHALARNARRLREGDTMCFDGAGDLWIVPGVFAWTGRETYTQTVIDPFAPVTADNLESLNYVTTGPRFTLHPTLRTTLTLDGTYSYMNSSSKSPLYVNIDNHRYSGVVTFSHAISNSSSVYITGSHDKVEFTDQADNNNFRQDQALAGFKITGARTV